ncbi:MAG: hypothetical protein K1X67_16185 [Fimbriimonadaceae bacterium]|nr:hypothetical protein [Fimbriimonadaceae bacterium]
MDDNTRAQIANIRARTAASGVQFTGAKNTVTETLEDAQKQLRSLPNKTGGGDDDAPTRGRTP